MPSDTGTAFKIQQQQQQQQQQHPSHRLARGGRYVVTPLLWFILGMAVATIYKSLTSVHTSIVVNNASNNVNGDEEFERLREELEHLRNDNARLRVSRDMAKEKLATCLKKQ